jgi:hypothetical protein
MKYKSDSWRQKSLELLDIPIDLYNFLFDWFKCQEGKWKKRKLSSKTLEARCVNPPYLPLKGHTLRVFEGSKIPKLHLDPKEWRWKKRGSLFESNILGYTTRMVTRK